MKNLLEYRDIEHRCWALDQIISKHFIDSVTQMPLRVLFTNIFYCNLFLCHFTFIFNWLKEKNKNNFITQIIIFTFLYNLASFKSCSTEVWFVEQWMVYFSNIIESIQLRLFKFNNILILLINSMINRKLLYLIW